MRSCRSHTHPRCLPARLPACLPATCATLQMDLSLGVAVGSSIQIAIFAIPFAVLYAWATGRPFSLDFDPFAVMALTISVIHANFVTSDAQSHWLMGIQLIATYVLIALTFLYR
jgi:Ca2+:H+ antiporter